MFLNCSNLIMKDKEIIRLLSDGKKKSADGVVCIMIGLKFNKWIWLVSKKLLKY